MYIYSLCLKCHIGYMCIQYTEPGPYSLSFRPVWPLPCSVGGRWVKNSELAKRRWRHVTRSLELVPWMGAWRPYVANIQPKLTSYQTLLGHETREVDLWRTAQEVWVCWSSCHDLQVPGGHRRSPGAWEQRKMAAILIQLGLNGASSWSGVLWGQMGLFSILKMI